jgi:hypothetical protein
VSHVACCFRHPTIVLRQLGTQVLRLGIPSCYFGAQLLSLGLSSGHLLGKTMIKRSTTGVDRLHARRAWRSEHGSSLSRRVREFAQCRNRHGDIRAYSKTPSPRPCTKSNAGYYLHSPAQSRHTPKTVAVDVYVKEQHNHPVRELWHPVFEIVAHGCVSMQTTDVQ